MRLNIQGSFLNVRTWRYNLARPTRGQIDSLANCNAILADAAESLQNLHKEEILSSTTIQAMFTETLLEVDNANSEGYQIMLALVVSLLRDNLPVETSVVKAIKKELKKGENLKIAESLARDKLVAKRTKMALFHNDDL